MNGKDRELRVFVLRLGNEGGGGGEDIFGRGGHFCDERLRVEDKQSPGLRHAARPKDAEFAAAGKRAPIDVFDGVARDEGFSFEVFGVGGTGGASGADCRIGEKCGRVSAVGQDRRRQNIDIDRRFDVGFGAEAPASVAEDEAEADDGGGTQGFCFY